MTAVLAKLLINLMTICGVMTFACKVCSLWWSEGETKLRGHLENFWVQTADALPESIVLKPLGVLAAFFDRLFGPAKFSRQALGRSALITILLLMLAWSIAGLCSGNFLGFSTPPWAIHRIQQDFLVGVLHDPKLAEAQSAAEPFRQNIADLARLSGTRWEIVYTVYFLVVVLGSTAVINAVALALSRLILKEILSVKSSLGIILMWAVNGLVVVGLLGFFMITLFILLNYAIWPFLPLAHLLTQIGFWGGVASLAGLTALAWIFTGIWFKVVIALALFPLGIQGAVIAGCAVGFPFRRTIQFLSVRYLERGLERKGNLFDYVGTTIALIGTLIAAAAQLIN